METTQYKKRNDFVDIMRGVAMLLVILGHTMTGCTEHSQDSFLYNIIWALQIPLFVLISGYVTKYSHEVKNVKTLIQCVKKNTIALLLPWIMWTFVIRGFIFRKDIFLNPMYILWHMDAGYWFLTTIWAIKIIFFVSEYLGNQFFKKNKYLYTLGVVLFFLLGWVILAIIGYIFGYGLFGIKLTLYYTPYYLIGYLFGQVQDVIEKNSSWKIISSLVVAISVFVWLFLLVRFNLYELSDNYFGIPIRIIASLTGCISVCGLCKGLFNQGGGTIRWVGIHSLELYLTHYLFLNLMAINPKTITITCLSIPLIIFNYLMTVVITVAMVVLLNQNRICRFLLYGKK